MRSFTAVVPLLLCAPMAHAQLIEFTGSATVEDNSGITVAFQGQTATFRIVIDPAVTPQPGGGSDPLAEFVGAVVSFRIDGFDVPINGTSEISYERLQNRDVLDIDAGSGAPYEADFEGRLPLSYFGQSPFSLDTLGSLVLGDFTNIPEVSLLNRTTGAEADAEVFALSVQILNPPCPADFDGDGSVNVLDVVAFVNNWNAEGTGADFNDDGAVDVLDVVAFLAVWNAGCP